MHLSYWHLLFLSLPVWVSTLLLPLVHAAQIAALWVIEWGISGLTGFLVAMLMTMPIAAFFGYLIGKLMNKMKGQEMIGGLILGYFANGLYQLLFLFIFGNLIPLKAPAGDQGIYRCCQYHRPFYRPWF